MKIIRPPAIVPAEDFVNSLFLAGGISGAPIWKPDLIGALQATELNLLDPHRADYGALAWDDLREQIRWEHDGLRGASAISFWFPAGAPCSISLYELGSWLHWRDENGDDKPIFVGVENDYAQRPNVILQTELERPDIEVVSSLDALATQIRAWQQNF